MSFDVQIANSVEEVGQEVWDRLSRSRPFTSYRWYRFGEKAMTYAKPQYIILSLEGEPVARATFWLTSQELMPLDSKAMNFALELLLRRWPLLLCQAPLSSTAVSGLILPESSLRDKALATLATTALDLLYQYRGSFCIFSYLEEGETRWPSWPAGYVAATTPGPGTRLTIAWPDFDSYLMSLNKKQRYNLRRNLRLASEQGIEVKTYPGVTDVDKAMELHRNVNKHHRAPTEPWMRGALEHADMVDSLWITAQVDGQIVGCELMLSDGDVWLVTGLGLDYKVQYTYFVLGYTDIQCAIERGARVLRWGSLTYEVKERLGFQKEGNNHDVFAGRGLFQKLGQWVATSWT